ncbi:benzoate/H(+) symporter BenE family transporter [Brevundimonas sp.]
MSALTAAAVGVIVGFGGTVALVVQAGQNLGASPLQVVSMVTALCLGIGVPGLLLSWRLRIPVILAWSTPGAALLAASTLGLDWSTAVGAFIIAGLLMVVVGLVPAIGRLAARIPSAIASAMLAGVLLPFVIKLFLVFPTDLALAAGLTAVFLIARRLAPTWALPLVLVSTFAALAFRGQLALPPGGGLFGALSPAVPHFDLKAAISLALPLFLVTLVSQNLPGLVVLRTAGYEPPPGPLLLSTGAATVLLAPFGVYGINMAAIVAAICTGPEAHPDKDRRWVVGVIYGGLYLVAAAFAAPLAGLFIVMPQGALALITGLALIGPLTGALVGAVGEPQDREPAILTFAATASGVAMFGIGSAFWGLVIGFAALAALRWRRR